MTRPQSRTNDQIGAAKGFGSAIARARALLGETQEGLADRLGVNRVTVARWETGERTPSDEDVTRVVETAVSEFARQGAALHLRYPASDVPILGQFVALIELLPKKDVDEMFESAAGRHVIARLRLIGTALILLGRTRLTPQEWALALAREPKSLKEAAGSVDLDGIRRLDFAEVALELEAAVRGTRASAMRIFGDERKIAEFIGSRLEAELELQRDLLCSGVEIGLDSWGATRHVRERGDLRPPKRSSRKRRL